MADIKGLAHFTDNPDELDVTNADQMAAIMAELKGIEEPAPKEEPAAAPAAAPEAKPAEAAPAAVVEHEGTNVLAPDGKSVIPYAVLKGEREARANAERLGVELSGTVNALTERIKALEGTTPGKTAAADADDIEAEIAAIEDEAPVVAGLLRKMHSALVEQQKAVVGKVQTLEERNAQFDQEEQDLVNAAVAKAIDSTPALVHWKALPDQALYEEAKSFDSLLKNRPEWAAKTFEDRFAHVVKLVVANHDESILPPSAKPPVAPKPSAPTQQEILAQAEAKLKKTATPAAVTLTDLPPGAAPEQTEDQTLEAMTLQDIHRKFDGWSPQKIQDWMRAHVA